MKDDINDTLLRRGTKGARDRHDGARKFTPLDDIHRIFRDRLGNEYDLGTLDAVLAVAAAERLPGDPPWLLIISGPGNAKTETVASVGGIAGTHVVSTIASEGALLSASSKKTRVKGATGGLLRKIGPRGILIIKDFTSILSMDRNVRGPVLSALREIHDGCWVRNVGSDGGQTITWEGRIVIVGACTSAWDSAHGVIAAMGDRFVTIRSSSRVGRVTAASHAVQNTGNEPAIRKEIADAVAALIAAVTPCVISLEPDEEDRLVKAANIATLLRTAVETDHLRNVIDAHDPEMPTRLVKQLVQIFRGALSIGISRDEALALALRCARESVPQLRLAVLRDLDGRDLESCRVTDVATRLQKPWTTIKRTLETLHILELLKCTSFDRASGAGEARATRHYSLAPGVCLDPLMT
jgi:hypothetical protein